MNNNEAQYYNSFFTKSDDVDLSDTTKVAVAYLSSVLSPLPQQVINHNRKNPEMRVVIEDYASYNSKENGWSGAGTKLMNDMISGIHTPDIENEDIVGAVKNTYKIDGRLSAVAPSFRLQTVLDTKSAPGDMTLCTLDELIDFIVKSMRSYTFYKNFASVFI